VANTAQARKRIRQNEKHRKHNAAQRSMMRTYIKKVKTAIESCEKTAANDALKTAASVLDKMVAKGLIHKNKAARQKKRLNSKVKTL
jgi:small subunit ribosomal protein S20